MLHNLDDSATILQPSHLPLSGIEARNYYRNARDTGFVLTWEPKGGSIAAGNDYGCTYGIYTLRTIKDGSIHKGTYATVWRRRHGLWKMMLDTGNPGTGKE